MDYSQLFKFLDLWKAFAEHEKAMNNRPNSKIEWETLVDKKMDHFLKTIEPTAGNDDDRDYWRPQMKDILNTIHFRYKNDDPLSASLIVEKNAPLLAAGIIGIAALASLIKLVWQRHDAPPAYPGH